MRAGEREKERETYGGCEALQASERERGGDREMPTMILAVSLAPPLPLHLHAPLCYTYSYPYHYPPPYLSPPPSPYPPFPLPLPPAPCPCFISPCLCPLSQDFWIKIQRTPTSPTCCGRRCDTSSTPWSSTFWTSRYNHL